MHDLVGVHVLDGLADGMENTIDDPSVLDPPIVAILFYVVEKGAILGILQD